MLDKRITMLSLRNAMAEMGPQWDAIHLFADDLHELYLRPVPTHWFASVEIFDRSGIVLVYADPSTTANGSVVLGDCSARVSDSILSAGKRTRGTPWPIHPLVLLVKLEEIRGKETIRNRLVLEHRPTTGSWSRYSGPLIRWAHDRLAAISAENRAEPDDLV
jgi:hypothetical protein